MDEVLAEVIGKSQPGGMRRAEYTWAFGHLVPPPARVLDVGCINSYLSFGLLRLGYDVHGIDTRLNGDYHWEPWIHPETYRLWGENKTAGRVKFKLGDIRRTDYPNDYFDQIFAISTLEHVGLAVYDNPADDVPGGDFKAMREIARILKPGGNALITFGYGRVDWTGLQNRVYDDSRLGKLLEGFKLLEQKFYGSLADPWPEVTKEEAIEVQKKEPYGNLAITCLKVMRAA
jgi:SAM-dependent methyltransferase